MKKILAIFLIIVTLSCSFIVSVTAADSRPNRGIGRYGREGNDPLFDGNEDVMDSYSSNFTICAVLDQHYLVDDLELQVVGTTGGYIQQAWEQFNGSTASGSTTYVKYIWIVFPNEGQVSEVKLFSDTPVRYRNVAKNAIGQPAFCDGDEDTPAMDNGVPEIFPLYFTVVIELDDVYPLAELTLETIGTAGNPVITQAWENVNGTGSKTNVKYIWVGFNKSGTINEIKFNFLDIDSMFVNLTEITSLARINDYVGPNGAGILIDDKYSETYSAEYVVFDFGEKTSLKEVKAVSGTITGAYISNNAVEYRTLTAGSKARYLKVEGLTDVNELIIEGDAEIKQGLEINAISFTDGTSKIVSVDTRKSVGVEAEISNWTPENKTVTVYFGLFDEKNVLRAVGSAGDTLLPNTKATLSTVVATPDITVGDGYKMKAFLWEENSLKPICNAEIMGNFKY